MKCPHCNNTDIERIREHLYKCKKCGFTSDIQVFFDIHQKWTKEDDKRFIERITGK